MHMDKRIWLLLIVGLGLPVTTAYSQWLYLGLGGKVVNELKTANQTIYACTDAGIYDRQIARTDTQWTFMGLQDKSVNGLVSISPDTLLASTWMSGVGGDTISIYRTVDGGASWQPYHNGFGPAEFPREAKDLERSPDLPNVIFATGSHAFLAAKSDDLGASWRPTLGDWYAAAMGTHFVHVDPAMPSIVWAGGETAFYSPFLMKSRDWGESWQWSYSGGLDDNACYCIATAPADTNVAFVGTEGEILKTEDGGDTWSSVYSPGGYPYFYGVVVSPLRHDCVYAAGGRNSGPPQDLILHISEDGGTSWQLVVEGTTDHRGVRSLLIIAESSGDRLILGTAGAGVYQYQHVLSAVGEDRGLASSKAGYLSISYPNPFNPQTVIQFKLICAADVSIEIFSIGGRYVDTILAKRQPEGVHEISWNGRDSLGRPVASGTYFYRLTAGPYTETKRMVLVR
jgi:hypothetical protein